MREAQPRKPAVLIRFENGECTWHSAGWMNDKSLMKSAKDAIRDGATPDEVIALLSATFSVIIEHTDEYHPGQ